MNRFFKILVWFNVVLMFVCCQLSDRGMEVIHHKPINDPYDYSLLSGLPGITLNTSNGVTAVGDLTQDLSCDYVSRPSNSIGSIIPLYPLIQIGIIGRDSDERQIIESEGYFSVWVGMAGAYYRRYAVFKDGTWHVLKNMNDLKNMFAPIETKAEALSYAILATCYYPRYDLSYDSDYTYYTNVIEETYVTENDTTYTVVLFDDTISGCESPYLDRIRIRVGFNGDVSIIDSKTLCENKNTIICAD